MKSKWINEMADQKVGFFDLAQNLNENDVVIYSYLATYLFGAFLEFLINVLFKNTFI